MERHRCPPKEGHSKGILWYEHLTDFSFIVHHLSSLNSPILSATIYLSLIQLEGEFTELEDYHKRSRNSDVLSGKRKQGQSKLSERDFEREKECGTCMEKSAKMVLPICGLNLDSVLPFLPWQPKENELCRFRGSHQ